MLRKLRERARSTWERASNFIDNAKSGIINLRNPNGRRLVPPIWRSHTVHLAYLNIVAIIAIPVAFACRAIEIQHAFTIWSSVLSVTAAVMAIMDRFNSRKHYSIVVASKDGGWFIQRVNTGISETIDRSDDFKLKPPSLVKRTGNLTDENAVLCRQLRGISSQKDVSAVIVRPVVDKDETGNDCPEFHRAIKSLLENGIFVAIIDSNVTIDHFTPEEQSQILRVSSNDSEGGRLMAEFILSRRKNNWRSCRRSTDLLILSGPSRATPARRRSRFLIEHLVHERHDDFVMETEKLPSWEPRDALLGFENGLTRMYRTREIRKSQPKRELIVYAGTDWSASHIDAHVTKNNLEDAWNLEIRLIGYNGSRGIDGEFEVVHSPRVIATVDAVPKEQGIQVVERLVEQSRTHAILSNRNVVLKVCLHYRNSEGKFVAFSPAKEEPSGYQQPAIQGIERDSGNARI